MISQKLLLSKGGIIRKYLKNQNVFFEGNMPKFYYQVIEGNIKMVSINENGREFIHEVFTNGQSFGEPSLLINKPYPATAVIIENTQLIKLPREEFIKILMQYPDISFHFSKVLAQRVYDKAQLAKAITLYTPEQRITALFKTLKESGSRSKLDHKVELSRQAIADRIGFRVETVIRTIKNLEKKNVIKIEKGKIYL
jgi:CRP-like cAMP-binding protein